MSDSGDTAASQTGRTPAWLRFILMLVVLIGAGLAIWLYATSSDRTRSGDMTAVREVSIVASNFQSWPDTAHQIAKTNLFHAAKPGGRLEMYHPEIGRFTLRYSKEAPLPPMQRPARPAATGETKDDSKAGGQNSTAAPCMPAPTSRCVDIVDGRVTVRGVALGWRPTESDPYYDRAIAQQKVLPGLENGPIYYSIADLPLRSILNVTEAFEHVLIVEGSTKEAAKGQLPALNVVAQIGRPEIPIRSLNELPKLRDQTSEIAEAAAKLDKSGSTSSLVNAIGPSVRPDALVPVDSRVAGRPYRLYLYPVSIESTDRVIDFYVVGIAASKGGLFDFDLAGATAFSFALALAMLLALTPVIKLAFLGPVDGIRRLELAGIVAGLALAAAIASTAVLLAWDVLSARSAAQAAMVAQSKRLALNINGELLKHLGDGMPTALANLLPNSNMSKLPDSIISIQNAYNSKLPNLNTSFFLDRSGRQSLDTPVISLRDQPGADFNVPDRAYFNRALTGDFEPGSEALVSEALSGDCLKGGRFVVEQIRSRPDGVAKTVVAVPVREALAKPFRSRAAQMARSGTTGSGVGIGAAEKNDPCKAAAARHKSEARVMVLSFVMRSMLAPAIETGSTFAVVDLGESDWPVIFHAKRGRAHIEYLEGGLDDAARRAMVQVAARPPTAVDCATGSVKAEPIAGSYEGVDGILAVARIPCTRWAVLSAADRDLVDRSAARASFNAMVIWLGLAFLVGIGAVAVVAIRRRDSENSRKYSLKWMWPDEARCERYAPLWKLGLAAALLALLLSPLTLVSLIICLAAVSFILFRLSRDAEVCNQPLSERTERHFHILMLVMLLLLSVAPMAALVSDARDHFKLLAAEAQAQADSEANMRAASLEREIIRVFRIFMRDRPFDVAAPVAKTYSALPHCSLTGEARQLAFGGDAALGPAGSGHATEGVPAPPWLVAVILLAAIVVGLVLVAVRTVGRCLFGFGIALEAVDYPRFSDRYVWRQIEPDGEFVMTRELDMKKVRNCFMAIGAPSWVREALKAEAGANAYDLYEACASQETADAVKLPGEHPHPRLLLLYDFELLFRDEARRKTALALIERLLIEQKAQREDWRCRIGLIADLSPLDRFLQSSEHQESSTADDSLARWKSAEDIRWSRILESFTNYVYRAAPRDISALKITEETKAIQLVMKEVEYLPDHVIEAIIPDDSKGLKAAEIVTFARNKGLSMQTDAAIIDFLASQLIEHYHYLWSVSSRAEQILIYRFAHGQLVNIAEAYALRSLVRRGIVVLDPVPRIMNRSFAQFVRHVEEPKRLKKWQENQPHGLWTRLRAPLTLVLPLLLAFFVLLLVESSNSLLSTMPLLLAAGPAVLNMVGGFKRNFG